MAQNSDATRHAETKELPPLKLSRVYAAPPETVFRAWSSADHVARWFAPEGCTITETTVELHVGGRFDLHMESQFGANWIRGTIVEVAPPRRLVIDMLITGDGETPLFRARTEVDFAVAPGGTKLDVTQTYTLIDLSKEWMIAGAPEGWRSTLDRLAQEVARLAAA